MKVAIIGAGALGTLYGGLLAADGHDVWLLHHRADAAATIDEEGVVIEGVDGETRRVVVRATVDAAAVGPADLAVVLVKAHQTLSAVEQHAACIGPETRVLSLQNGVTNHYRLRDHVGADRTLNGVVNQGAVPLGPGHVRRSSEGLTELGGPDREFAERVAETFDSAGLETTVVDDPFDAIWKKQLVGGALKPLAALTRLTNGALVADDGLAETMLRLMEETAAVAATEGHDLDARATHADLVERMAGSEHRSSMLQDVEAGRKTEIEDVNGAVVELGREAGVDVPYNELATRLVRGLERSYLGD